jgi:hypothetical protein
MSFTKIKNLYIAINHVVAEIGKDGEIQRRSEFVEDLLTALHAIDQGEFKPGLFDRAQTKLETNAAQITQLQAEVEALRKGAEWLLVIEQPPEEGTLVQAWCEAMGLFDAYMDGDSPHLWRMDGGEHLSITNVPTYWQHKPNPPAIKGEQS